MMMDFSEKKLYANEATTKSNYQMINRFYNFFF